MRHKLKTLLICISIIVLCCFSCITASAASNLELTYQYKLGLERLMEDFPTGIELTDSDGNSVSVSVNGWTCIEDYDQNLGVYHFTPIISEDEIAKLYHEETTEGKTVTDSSDTITLPQLTVYVQDESEGVLGGYLNTDDALEIPFYDDICDEQESDNAGIALLSLFEEEDNAYYNAYESELLPEIRNQNPEGTCWAFSTLGAMEANLILKGYADRESIDLSELQLAYFTMHKYDDPMDCHDGDSITLTGSRYLSHGGTTMMAVKTLANGVGAVREGYAPFSKGNSYVVPQEYAVDANYANLTEVGAININDRDSVKEAIRKYGSVSVAVNGSRGNFASYSVQYSAVHNSFYGTANEVNHSVMIVGWDDNFSKDNYYEGLKPEADGAWLVRNSWGLDDYGLNGYFWLSYYDGGLVKGGNAYYFVADTNVYDHIYGYDSNAYSSASENLSNGSGISQTFSIQGGQKIEAIGYETKTANLNISVEITYGGNVVGQTGTATCIGYHTLKLDEPIEVAEDTEIVVSIRFTSKVGSSVSVPYEHLDAKSSVGFYSTRLTYKNVHEARETRFLYSNGSSMIIDYDAILKVLTNDLDRSDKMELTYDSIYDYQGSGYQLELTMDSIDVALNDISWSSDNSSVATVDEYGYVTVGYKKGSALIHGEYTGNAKTYRVECNVTVKPYSISYKNMDGVKGTRVRTYYPGDTSGCSLSTVYKEGYSFNGWYMDEALTNEVIASNLLTMSNDITLYPKWNDASLTVYYYEMDTDGNYTSTRKQLIDSPVTTSAMPYKLPGADDTSVDPNEAITAYNEAHATNLAFSYWSKDAEGEEPIIELDAGLYNLHMEDSDGLYHQNNSIILYPQYREALTKGEVSLQLNGKIGLNFYLSLPKEASYVVLDNNKGQSIKYPVSDIYKKGSMYCYTYFVAVKELANDISISIFDSDNLLIPIADKSSRNGAFCYSVQDYIEEVINPEKAYKTDLPKLFNLCDVLDGYSKEVRRYFYYNTDASYESKELDTADFSDYQQFILLMDGAPQYMGTSLILDSDTAIRHYFYNDDEEHKLSNYIFTIADDSNEQVVYPVINEEYGYIEIRNIPAVMLDKTYTFKIYSLSNEYLGELGYSALSYAYRASFSNSNTDSLMRICNYLKLYNDAAKAYWADMQTYYSNSVASLQLNYNNLSMNVDESSQLIANCLPMDSISNSISWSSSDPSVVSVDAYGNIRALAYGKALIKAKSSNDVWSQCLVTVAGGEKAVVDKNEDGTVVISLNGQKLEAGTGYVDIRNYMETIDSPTVAINTAISELTEECNTLYFSKCSDCLAKETATGEKVQCTYSDINAADRIFLKSNINIVIDDDVYLVTKANGSDHSDIFRGENIENVTISGGHFVGERYIHKDTAGEWGMGIGLYSCNNVRIYGVEISQCWGDGIYIGSSDNNSKCNNIQIIDCNLYDNRRNNLSLVAGDNILIDGCSFSYANGTDPQNGMDLEPNYTSIVCNDISIYNSHFYGNNKYGFSISYVGGNPSLDLSANRVDIVGCRFDDGFVNVAGTDTHISDSDINSISYIRRGIAWGDNVHFNDGTDAEDTLVGYYSADVSGINGWSASYKIDDSNKMSCSQIVGTNDGGRKAIRLQRTMNGTDECGYAIRLSSIAMDGRDSLDVGDYCRLEFVVKGTGNWASKTTQTSWYPIKPDSNGYTTCVATHKIESSGDMVIYLYTTDLSAASYLDVESIRVYKVN